MILTICLPCGSYQIITAKMFTLQGKMSGDLFLFIEVTLTNMLTFMPHAKC